MTQTWTHTFDFSQDDFGWTWVDANNAGVWSASNGGWSHTCPSASPSHRLRIKRAFNTTKITQVTITYDAVEGEESPYGRPGTIRLFYRGSQVAVTAFEIVTGDSQTKQVTYNNNVDTLDVRLWASSISCSGSILLTKVVVVGEGVDPFIGTDQTWCHLFDFVNDGDGGFVPRRTTEGVHIVGAGWRDGSDDRVVIEKEFTEDLTLTEIQAIADVTCGGFTSQVTRVIRLTKDTFTASEALLGNCVSGADRVYTWTGQANADKIHVNMWASNGGAKGTITIKSVRLKGYGTNPFLAGTPEHTTQTQLDTTFNAVKTALQANPSTHPQTEFNAYRDAIISAFGVTFANETDADEWGQSPRMGTALHFARLGLEATADAFKRWVDNEVQNQDLCLSVDKFALFRRITNGLILNNAQTTADNVALTEGRTINVNRASDNSRQWVMTPNNLIHELGHFLSRSSGFGTSILGSIEYSISSLLANYTLETRYTRDGFGPDFLRSQITPGDFSTFYYVHANVQQSSGDPDIAEFSPIQTDLVSPASYLLYDLFGDDYNLWNSAYNIYITTTAPSPQARVDLFVQNYPLLPGVEPRIQDDIEFDFTRRGEITADAFLDWVRGVFEGTRGSDFEDFYNNNIGMFLRTAVIYNYPGGMVQFYKDQGIIPQTPIMMGSMNSGYGNYGIHPSAKEIGTPPFLNWGTAQNLLPANFAIYGRFTPLPGDNISDGSLYWILVEDNIGRLGWLEADSVNHDATILNTSYELDADALSPSRDYDPNDLPAIIGV